MSTTVATVPVVPTAWVIVITIVAAIACVFIGLYAHEKLRDHSEVQMGVIPLDSRIPDKLLNEWGIREKTPGIYPHMKANSYNLMKQYLLRKIMEGAPNFVSSLRDDLDSHRNRVRNKWICGPSSPNGKSLYNSSFLLDRMDDDGSTLHGFYMMREDDDADIFGLPSAYLAARCSICTRTQTVEFGTPHEVRFVDQTGKLMKRSQTRVVASTERPVVEDARPMMVFRIPDETSEKTCQQLINSAVNFDANVSIKDTVNFDKFVGAAMFCNRKSWQVNMALFKLVPSKHMTLQLAARLPSPHAHQVDKNWMFFQVAGEDTNSMYFFYNFAPRMQIYRITDISQHTVPPPIGMRKGSPEKLGYKLVHEVLTALPGPWKPALSQHANLTSMRLTCMCQASETEIMLVLHQKHNETNQYVFYAVYLDMATMNITRYVPFPVLTEMVMRVFFTLQVMVTGKSYCFTMGINDSINGVTFYNREQWEKSTIVWPFSQPSPTNSHKHRSTFFSQRATKSIA